MGVSLHEASTANEVTVKMTIVGLALGLPMPLYTLAIQNAVSQQQIGVATASATFFRQIGATVGVAVMGTVFATTLGRELAARGAPPFGGTDVVRSLASREAFVIATEQVYRVGAGLVLVAALLTLFLPGLPLRKTNR
jgi:hypothetical protein